MSQGRRSIMRVVAVVLISILLGTASRVLAQVTVSVDENAHGQIVSGGGTFPTPGAFKADPGPGGLPNVLTYDLLNPPSLVAGDVLMQEGVGGPILDVVRFNPAGTGGAGYPASLVFYSDNTDGVDALADTPSPPTATYPNTVTIQEVGPEGNNGAVYVPVAGQPGFVAGFVTTYNLVSDGTIPEPTTLALVTLGGASLSLRRRWHA
jgi:hypothetical protein